eukprot:766286-Hanusia_phi.AAC.3
MRLQGLSASYRILARAGSQSSAQEGGCASAFRLMILVCNLCLKSTTAKPVNKETNVPQPGNNAQEQLVDAVSLCSCLLTCAAIEVGEAPCCWLLGLRSFQYDMMHEASGGGRTAKGYSSPQE